MKGKVSFVVILVIVLAFVVVATQPSLVLFGIFFLYALSGPILTIRSVNKLKLEHVVGDNEDDDAEFKEEKQEKSSKNNQDEQ